jgi:hypothetical protein
MTTHLTQTPAELDLAVLERRATEDVAISARRHIDRLPTDSALREQLDRLAALAPEDRPSMTSTAHPLAAHPDPVRLHPKVVKAIAVEASLDVDWEAMWEDRPEKLVATYERIGVDIEYIRLLLSGELTEAWAVLRCQKQLRRKSGEIAEEIGAQLLGLDHFDQDAERRRVAKREADKRIKKLRKQARRVWVDCRECSRFWDEHMEHSKDQEAAERLGLAVGGGA